MGEHKGLLARIYRTTWDCTNDGLSRRDGADEVVVFGSDDVPMDGYIARGEYAYPEVTLERGAYGTIKCVALRTPMQEGGCGPMMGGNFVYTCDSRFQAAVGFYGAVPLHDRYETAIQNKELSR